MYRIRMRWRPDIADDVARKGESGHKRFETVPIATATALRVQSNIAAVQCGG
jgi:hypothetical protein